MRAESYLLSAKAILQHYNGPLPFAAWLKDYFRQHKKYGSRDRKAITQLCYCYFRLGGAFKEFDIIDSLLIAQFLCARTSNYFLEAIRPSWNEKIQLPLQEKLLFLDAQEELSRVFPFAEELSNEIDKDKFPASFFIQPDLFIRVRPGEQEEVERKLSEATIPYEHCASDCLRLSNSVQADSILLQDKEYVVQDLNSQRVLDPLLPLLKKSEPHIWDCCAASGGKSILAVDKIGKLKLTVSDIRESILVNLSARFRRAGIHDYRSFIIDLNKRSAGSIGKFDIIICDAPCSGSGTWGRTPEQLTLFSREKIDQYARLQKQIAKNASVNLGEEGWFLYITCSVFKAENEEVVGWLQESSSMKLVEQKYFKGYEEKADTLFAALFRL